METLKYLENLVNVSIIYISTTSMIYVYDSNFMWLIHGDERIVKLELKSLYFNPVKHI